MKINDCYVYWILLLVTFVSSCFFFILVTCEVAPSDLQQQIAGNSSIVQSADTSSDKSIVKELVSSDISPSHPISNNELKAELSHGSENSHQEDAAAVHSSFADAEAKPSWSSDIVSRSPNDVNMSPEIVTEFNNGLTEAGQEVVLTLLESATTELQKQLQTEGLSSSLNDALASDNLTVETPPSPPNQMPPLQEAPNQENRSREEPEDDNYVTQAEPKVLEVRYNVVDVEAVILPGGLGKKLTVVSDDTKEVEPAYAEDKPPSADGVKDSVAGPAGDVAPLPPTPTPDEIPSFSEWAQKKMEEAEKNVLNGTTAGGLTPPRPTSSSKLRSKNYASPDCGAKIVASNPEAESANSVLSPSRDEYVLNACVNRIWLVVELCEAIQAKKIDIANFELFSSSPKDFSVSVSDRFPSRDWRSVGQFTAQDVRDVQSYDLHPHLFGKFVKVELHSHYGSEHYCPVSLIRVYGTSEFEVLETEVEAHHATQEIDEDDEEGTLEAGDPGDPPRNLFGSARAVVMSIVKKATEALVKGGEAANATAPGDGDDWITSEPAPAWSSTPSHLIVCDNCSEVLFASVWDLLGHNHKELYEFVQVPFVQEALRSGPVCAEYGLEFGRRRPLNYPSRPDPGDYLKSLLPDSHVAALCNALAVLDRKVALNVSRPADNGPDSDTDVTEGNGSDTAYGAVPLLPPVATCSVTNLATSALSHGEEDTVASQINPTRTLTEAEAEDRLFASTRLPEVDPTVDSTVDSTIGSIEVNATVDAPPPSEVEVTRTLDPSPEEASEPTESLVSEEDSTLDTLLSELKDLDPSLDVTSSPPAAPSSAASQPPPQKESVFVRISNRIKALERNMSLSGQYLEELSRRYKKQVEEISRTLNRTLAAAEAEARRRDELERRGSEEMSALRGEVALLTAAVDALLADREGGWRHLALVAAEVLLLVGALWLCSGAREGRRRWSLGWRSGKSEKVPAATVRRKSMETGKRCSPKARRKRPSEVALNIAGTYADLLIAEPQPAGTEVVWTAPKAETKRRRRRKKEAVGLPKSSSSASLQHKTSRKTSTNSSSGGGSGPYGSNDVRRASLSELGGSFWLPVNGNEDLWTREQEEPLRVNLVADAQTSDIAREPSEQCVISVPQNIRTVETLCDSLPALREANRSPENLPKYRSLPVEIETTLGDSLPALREVNGSPEMPKYRSLPAFMKTAASSRAERRASETCVNRQSSQTGSVPTTEDAGGKKARGFKKMVKRFF